MVRESKSIFGYDNTVSSIYLINLHIGGLMIGYIYKTTNLINNKVYIGKHISSTHDNTYYGSGKIIKRAINKYGIENFSNEIIDTAETLEELNEKEKMHIQQYKDLHKSNCYNIASGGDGGNTLIYKSEQEVEAFRKKMTKINRARCSTSSFKQALSKATKERYRNEIIRSLHSEKIREVWSNPTLRMSQSDRLKNYYNGKERDCSFNYIPCIFELGEIRYQFKSIKDLREFLISEYDYNPDRRTFNRLMEQSKQGIKYVPYHKNNEKLQRLKGMLIYKIDEDVETNCDECNRVG